MSIGTTVFILAWIVCALVGAAIGYAKKRLALGAILGAAGGLIGVAIIACIPKKEEKPPVLTTNDQHHRRRSIVVLSIVYGLLGLLLLPWPIASFTAIFLFDAPIRSSSDEISRYLAAFAIWLYPVFFALALVRSLAFLRKKKSLLVITLPALLPLLSPLCLLTFFQLVGQEMMKKPNTLATPRALQLRRDHFK